MNILPLRRPTGASSPSGVRVAQDRFVASALTPIMLYMMGFALLPMVWAVALALLARLAWSRVHRRLVVQGG